MRMRAAIGIATPGGWFRRRTWTCVGLMLIAQPQAGMAQTRTDDSEVIAHEWGTFTSIAGNDGGAVEWSPLTGSTDLPGFVEHFASANYKVNVRGTVRMETPVVYFYTAREATVSVEVSFAKGLITEWYPHVNRVTPAGPITDVAQYDKGVDGSIAWNSVRLVPGSAAGLPRERRDNHYYAARETSAAPLRVMTPWGEQREKFLFYRGVANLAVPITARLGDGDRLRVVSQIGQEIPCILRFERRGEKLGYRTEKGVQNATILDPPELTATAESLRRDVEEALVAQGLYADEAHAMFETWRDSWFEEGSRLLYIAPRAFVDQVLPLTIRPKPMQTVRVFVGRLEIVTPLTERAIEQALASGDDKTIQRYGRFLEPILKTMMERAPSPAAAKRLQARLDFLSRAALVPAR